MVFTTDVIRSFEHELKFALPPHRTALLEAVLRQICRPDPRYPAGIVTSIYYDTPRFHLLREKANSDYLKTKIRMRWYSDGGAPSDDGVAFAEAKFRIGTQDQSWDGMDGPGQMTGTVMTIEPQFTVGSTKHSFFLTVPYTETSLSALVVDLADLGAGESVRFGGESGPVVPAHRRAGLVAIAPGGSNPFELRVCARVEDESFFFPGMPMGG